MIGSGTPLIVILQTRHILGVIPLLGVVGHSELAPLPTTIPIASGAEPIMTLQIRHTLGVMLL